MNFYLIKILAVIRGHMKWLYQVARISNHYFSLVVAWMFGPIYTGSGASLFGEGRKLVEMPGIVSLFFPVGNS